MRLLIETSFLRRIDDELILNIEDLGFRVFVREISSATQITQKPFLHHQQPIEDEDAASNDEVPGFEDLDEGGESDTGTRQTVHRDEQENHGEAVRMSQENSSPNSNSGNRIEQPEDSAVGTSINSISRTKTVMCSQNERSAEIINRILSSRGVRIDGSKSQNTEESVQEPPGFERRDMLSQDPRNCSVANAGDCLDAHNSTTEPLDVQVPSRVNKEPNKESNSGNANTQHPKLQQSSSNTSEDSVGRIAKEVERIGKVLGLTVVQNKKTVTKRALSLKKVKKPLHREGPPKRN